MEEGLSDKLDIKYPVGRSLECENSQKIKLFCTIDTRSD